ncbi:hypothetical protein ACFQ3W_16345 [Paenibacillus puldeungensis]|uniref:GGDEF domain-containing protein n=1 Tax=Paenibacillus puldeungensis TaxID=696536 RepID=A0ABW3RZC5_9BACL
MSDVYRTSAENGIRIALIGPTPMVEIMKRAVKGFPSFVTVAGTYQKPEEAVQLTEELMKEAEVLLFSGPISYGLCIEQLSIPKPAHFVPLTGSGLYRALYRLNRTYGLVSLSIDTLTEHVFTGTFRELGEPMPDMVFCPSTKVDTEELVRFHESQFRSGRAKAALTALSSVSEELNRRGVPNEWIMPTEQDVIVALERALLSTETRKSKEAQVVVGLIQVNGFPKLADVRKSEHEVQRLKLDIHRMMLEYVETLEGHLTALGGEEYLFVTTRGTFERLTGGYKYIPLAKTAHASFGLFLSIGIGFGRSANDAGTHARIALRQAQEAGGDSCFIVREDESVIGPLEMGRPLESGLALIEASLLKQAEEAGLTAAYLSRIVGQIARKGKVDYNVHDLAYVLGITVRSTHRLLLNWIDAGMVEITGEERGKGKGRPKQIYRFTFLQELVR